jgi:hypothetical protein
MGRMRKAMLVVLVGLVVAACGRVPQAGPRAGDQILYVSSATDVAVVDARTHTILTTLPSGVASADWKHYYSVSGTELLDIDPKTGAATRALPLPAPYLLPIVTSSGLPGGLSPDGRWLALQAPGTSHLLVVDTSFTQAARRINLDGEFTFDAISNDGTRVYLIQHAANGHYFVRDYVFGSGLDPNIIFDKSDGTAAMSGVRLMGVASADGSWLYSVYARSDESAFVHELSLDAPFALCVDLAGPGYAADEKAMRWSLATNAASGRMFAVNGPLGLVVELDSNSGQTAHTGAISGMKGGTSAVLTADGRSLLIGGAGVEWLGTDNLHVYATALQSWKVSGLTASSDGKTLYALSQSGKIAELDAAGHVLGTFDSRVSPASALFS